MIRARAALASYVEGGEDKAELSESEKLQSSHAIAMLDHKIGVNHLEGHLLSAQLEQQIDFPYLALIVSGGHTSLYHAHAHGDYQLLGASRDDAAGEA